MNIPMSNYTDIENEVINLAFSLKSSAFSTENEWRIIAFKNGNHLLEQLEKVDYFGIGHPRYIVDMKETINCGTKSIPFIISQIDKYIKLKPKFKDISNEERDQLPISEVMIGPSYNRAEQYALKKGIKDFLNKHKYNNVVITCSHTPYRSTRNK
jgi:hypothetical protein